MCLQSLQAERAQCHDCMVSINQRLQEIFGEAIQAVNLDVDNPPLSITPNTQPKFGDYQCNSAMAIAQVRLSREQLFSWD